MFLNVCTKNFSHISRAHVSKSKRCFDVKSTTYYFPIKTEMLTDFQICIRVPLMIALYCLRAKSNKSKRSQFERAWLGFIFVSILFVYMHGIIWLFRYFHVLYRSNSLIEDSTLFPCTFFYVISMVEKSTLFPSTSLM